MRLCPAHAVRVCRASPSACLCEKKDKSKRDKSPLLFLRNAFKSNSCVICLRKECFPPCSSIFQSLDDPDPASPLLPQPCPLLSPAPPFPAEPAGFLHTVAEYFIDHCSWGSGGGGSAELLQTADVEHQRRGQRGHRVDWECVTGPC